VGTAAACTGARTGLPVRALNFTPVTNSNNSSGGGGGGNY